MKFAAAVLALCSSTASAQFAAAPGSPTTNAYQHMVEMNNQAGMLLLQMQMAAQQRQIYAMRTAQQGIARQLASGQAGLRVAEDASPQMMNEMTIASLRTRGVDDGPTLIAVLHRPESPHAVSIAMLQGAAAQASVQQPGEAPQSAAPPSEVPAPPAMMIRPTFGAIGVGNPKFSVKQGKVTAGTKISVRTETHYSTLYYTTNGWTPTTLSAKYTGPITLNKTTHLEVMAIGPNYMRSTVERADYEVEDSAAPRLETMVAVPADGLLKAGTPVRVAFGGKEIDSEKAEVGDEITLLLDEDIKQGDKVLAPKGSPLEAALTVADPSHSSVPGDLVFEVRSIQINGKRVPLYGGETLEGEKGKNAIIKPGMMDVVFVAADTNLN